MQGYARKINKKKNDWPLRMKRLTFKGYRRKLAKQIKAKFSY